MEHGVDLGRRLRADLSVHLQLVGALEGLDGIDYRVLVLPVLASEVGRSLAFVDEGEAPGVFDHARPPHPVAQGLEGWEADAAHVVDVPPLAEGFRPPPAELAAVLIDP